MKTKLFAFLFSTLVLISCTPKITEQPDLDATVAFIAQTTMTADAALRASPIPDTTTPQPTTEAANAPTVPPITVATDTPSAYDSAPCLAAELTDETYPDGTYQIPGETFTQTWVLRNVGSCAWTDDFSFVLHHGSEGTQGRYEVGYVEPGKATTFSVTFTAPLAGAGEVTLSSFWSIQSPDGLLFGAAGYQYFWVSAQVAGATPTSRARDFVGSGYSYRSSGDTSPDIIVGDTGKDYISEAYITFGFGNIPLDAVVTNVYIDLSSSTTINGTPFGDLGCLTVTDNNTNGTAWRICSINELQSVPAGGQTALTAIQSAISGGDQVTFTLNFGQGTDADSFADHLQLYAPILYIDWYKP